VLRQETFSKITLAVQFSSRCVFFESNDDANEIKNAIDRLFSSEFAQSSGFALGEGRHRDAGSSYDEISAPLLEKNLKLYGSDGDVKRESASDEHKKLVALLRRGQTGETAFAMRRLPTGWQLLTRWHRFVGTGVRNPRCGLVGMPSRSEESQCRKGTKL